MPRVGLEKPGQEMMVEIMNLCANEISECNMRSMIAYGRPPSCATIEEIIDKALMRVNSSTRVRVTEDLSDPVFPYKIEERYA